jgi:2-methylcitrate dehydratase PrpD
MSLTRELADLVVDTDFEDLSEDVLVAARRAIVDTLGVTLAGSAEEGSRIVLDHVQRSASAPEATVVGSAVQTSAALAALANGASGHALDFDDVNGSMRGHPSVPLLPAVLALGEMLGCPGRALITAFVLGFEVECKLGRGMGASGYAQGWHATSVLGSIGAAAACAKLLDLDRQRARHALGIAASMASGSRQNFGTMTKPLHAGLAARNGVEAALLAASGFTADPEIIEAPMGFGRLFSPAGDWRPERVGDLGQPWEIVQPGLSVKKYPCCHMTHRALDAALDATEGRSIAEDAVAEILVRVPEGSTSALIHPRPVNGLMGKFSMEYCLAAAVLDGGVRLASFEDEAVMRPDAQALLRRVQLVHEPRQPGGYTPARVSVRLKDGRELYAEVMRERGNPSDPLSWDELVEKYLDCAAVVLPEEQRRMVPHLEETSDERPRL